MLAYSVINVKCAVIYLFKDKEFELPLKDTKTRREYQHRYYEEHREELKAQQHLHSQKPEIKAKA